ncbi:MAG: 50S ribosomal protein L22 [Candidatus Diapherotrites archaeon]|nr:50S ribosomal protein L22 [Candidatus Diapherotrites archaeon]
MVKRSYSMEIPGKTAKGMVKNARISAKYSREIATKIKGMTTTKALAYLDRVILLKEPVPMRRYKEHVSHQKGIHDKIKSGRYPIKACEVFKKLIEGVKTNADYKGLDSSNMKIVHVAATRGWEYPAVHKTHKGIKGIRRKSTNLEIILQET